MENTFWKKADRSASELAQALETTKCVRGSDFTHLEDMDRALHWARSYPEELRRVAAAIPFHDFLVRGRTRRAKDKRPRNQPETETLANKVFSLILGSDMDITAASRGIIRDAT